MTAASLGAHRAPLHVEITPASTGGLRLRPSVDGKGFASPVSVHAEEPPQSRLEGSAFQPARRRRSAVTGNWKRSLGKRRAEKNITSRAVTSDPPRREK